MQSRRQTISHIGLQETTGTRWGVSMGFRGLCFYGFLWVSMGLGFRVSMCLGFRVSMGLGFRGDCPPRPSTLSGESTGTKRARALSCLM